MDKPLPEMTLDELRAKRAFYQDKYIDSATEWGAAYGLALKYVEKIDQEIARREQADSCKTTTPAR